MRQRDLRRGQTHELIAIKIPAIGAEGLCVLARNDLSSLDPTARPLASPEERRMEAGVLLRAIDTLRREDMLTDAEFEAKRQRLTGRL